MAVRKKKLARKYLVRRIVAVAILIAVLVAIGGGIHAIAHRSSGSGASEQKSVTSSQSAKKSTAKSESTSNNFKSQKAKDSGVPDCTSGDVSVELKADATQVNDDATITFTKALKHTGSVDCLIDTNDDSLVLIVTNDAGTQVYRSDACSVDSAEVLLSQKDTYDKTTQWATAISNTAVDGSIADNATVNDASHGCMNDGAQAPHVSPGTYTAQLVSATEQDLQSQPVQIKVDAVSEPESENQQSDTSAQ